jgi:hypothetical protein
VKVADVIVLRPAKTDEEPHNHQRTHNGRSMKTDDANTHVDDLKDRCNLAPNWTVAVASSMVNVGRNWLPDLAAQSVVEQSSGVLLELAQNEAEGAQVVVLAPAEQVATHITWSVVNLTHNISGEELNATADITMAPYGFVHQGPCPFDALGLGRTHCPRELPYYCIHNEPVNGSRCVDERGLVKNKCIGCSFAGSGWFRQGGSPWSEAAKFNSSERWWPFPVLDWVQTFDVAADTAQPLLLTVRTSKNTRPGNYTGSIFVYDERQDSKGKWRKCLSIGARRSLPLTVIVAPFALPDEQSLTTMWGSSLSRAVGIYGTNWTKCLRADPRRPECDPNRYDYNTDGATAFSEFMLQHRMGGGSGIDGLFEAYASNASNLRELRRRGQRHLFIGGMTDCDHCAGPQTPTPGCNATQMPPDESCCDAQGC